jgi:2-polyprenyl-3-methyl-5-hydroxy-6-metoxy-1,4-benzoquinol methylase
MRQLGVGDDLPQEWREAFDVVISLEVVEHLFNPHHLVETARAVLKPGGCAIISTPYHGYLKNLALALFDKWDFHHHPERVGGHIKFWSKRTLRSLFDANNAFRAIEFRGAGRAPYLWNSMIWVFQKS